MRASHALCIVNLRLPLFIIMSTGFPLKDQRGRHQLSPEQRQMICDHIKSFKGRESHYSRNKSRRLYVPDTLNISKMFTLFIETNPDVSVSYESYRTIFNGSFNISFGYPRADTCSKCDELIAKLSHCNSKLEVTPNDADTLNEKTTLRTENELHQRKAKIFYARKRTAREKSNLTKALWLWLLTFSGNFTSPTSPQLMGFFLSPPTFC